MTHGVVRVVIAVALGACHAATPTRQPPVDWSRPPAPRTTGRFVPPAIETFTLRSGVHVLLVDNHRLPIATVLAVNTGAGSRAAPAGLAALTATLLNADTSAGTLEDLGSLLDIDIASDHATLALSALSEELTQSIDVLAEALRRPHFDEGDVTRARTARTSELAMHGAQPRIIAAQRFDSLVFGDHPYGNPAEGTADAIAGYQAADLRAQWARCYGPATTTLIVAGAVSRPLLEHALEDAFGDWANAPAPVIAAPTADPTPRLAYVDRPGAEDVAIVIGRRIPPLDLPQRLAADLENAAIGGPGSRLQHDLAGLGAGTVISASFWRGELGGTWSVATTVKLAIAASTVRMVLRTIEAARTTDLPASEVDRSRALMIRALPAAFESNHGVARALQRLVVQGLPLDYYRTYADRLAAITPAEARAAIAPLWRDLSIVVVGDWSRLGPQLASLGLAIEPRRPSAALP